MGCCQGVFSFSHFFLFWKLVVKIKLHDSLSVFIVVFELSPWLVKGRTAGPPEVEMMADSQTNLEAPALWKPFVRVCVCVVSVGMAESTDTLRKYKVIQPDWNASLSSVVSYLPPHAPPTPFLQDGIDTP